MRIVWEERMKKELQKWESACEVTKKTKEKNINGGYSVVLCRSTSHHSHQLSGSNSNPNSPIPFFFSC